MVRQGRGYSRDEVAKERQKEAQQGKELELPLLAHERAKIVPGEISWALLNADMKILQGYLGTFGTAQSSLWIGKMEAIHDRIARWIDGYVAGNSSKRLAYLGFAYHWKLLRVWVPLQLRLATEQVLYEKGEPWRQLVTGFGVVKEYRRKDS